MLNNSNGASASHYDKWNLCIIPKYYMRNRENGKSKAEGKDQESIQSNTNPDLEHHMENDKNTRRHNT